MALLSISVFSFDGKFPTLEGWQAEEPRMFDQENLYEHINGAAGLYLNYAFERLWVEYYRRGDRSLPLRCINTVRPIFLLAYIHRSARTVFNRLEWVYRDTVNPLFSIFLPESIT